MSEWEGGERQGIRWRRVLIALLVVALVGGGVYVVRNRNQLAIDTDNEPVAGVEEEDVEVVEVAPLTAGDRWYCPTTHPVVAFDDDYYPAHFPLDNRLEERPDACFVDAERAAGTGLSLADPPPDVVFAGGVYLSPAQAPTRRSCQTLADYVDMRVPCPTRWPTPAYGPSCGDDSCVHQNQQGLGVVIEHRTFELPEDWGGGTESNAKLTAVPIDVDGLDNDGDVVRVGGPSELVTCQAGARVEVERQPTIEYCEPGATWIPRIQGDPHGGATAAFWRDDEVVYGASVAGNGPEAAELLHAVIDGIEYVDPAPTGERTTPPGP